MLLLNGPFFQCSLNARCPMFVIKRSGDREPSGGIGGLGRAAPRHPFYENWRGVRGME
jgi:hypothetical protein